VSNKKLHVLIAGKRNKWRGETEQLRQLALQKSAQPKARIALKMKGTTSITGFITAVDAAAAGVGSEQPGRRKSELNTHTA
jgi:hypothetical protein